MQVRTVNTILLPWESWLYLENKSFQERCGKCHTKLHVEKMKRNFDFFAIYDGMKQIGDYDFGGATGNYEKSWEEHRWTRWSCEDMKRYLDEAGLPWKEGEQVERISV